MTFYWIVRYDTGMTTTQLGDIVQDQQGGWFYRDNGDGTYDNLSYVGDKATLADLRKPLVLVSDGVATGHGDALATRVALVLARRYATG